MPVTADKHPRNVGERTMSNEIRVVALALFLGGVEVVHADGAEPAYPSMAPLLQQPFFRLR